MNGAVRFLWFVLLAVLFLHPYCLFVLPVYLVVCLVRIIRRR